jgi:hypothetical protein
MIRTKGRYRHGQIELEGPIAIPEGALVDVTVGPETSSENDEWQLLGMDRLEQEWNNKRDAIYDHWRRLFGAQGS